MGIVRLNELPEGSGNLTNDDIFVFMDDPSGSGITKKISLSEIASAVGGGGGGGGNPFDQTLNTTDFPSFSGVSLSNGTTLAQGTFDNNTGGNNGISLNCYVGYELNWQGGHLKCTQDGGATSASITLDSALQFSDNVIVCSTADDLAAKYAAAKSLTPGGNALSATNRATLIIMPGNYSLSEELEIDAEFVDILGLGSMKLDRGCKTSVTLLNYTINVTANNVRVKGISVGTQSFKIGNNLPLQIIEDCMGGNFSFGHEVYMSGYPRITSGTFINCSGGVNSFGYSTDASGNFTNCVGGTNSFGCGVGASPGNASGTFTNCVGDENSFGGGGNTTSGKFIGCRLTTGTFPTLSGSGKIRLCIDGNYDVINADPPPPSVPGVPLNLSGSDSWHLYWSVPSSDGGSPITSYKVYATSESLGYSDIDVTDSGYFTIPSDIGGDIKWTASSITGGDLSWKISAVNAGGEGPKTDLFPYPIS